MTGRLADPPFQDSVLFNRMPLGIGCARGRDGTHRAGSSPTRGKNPDFASERDWREKDGENWVTPVQDQGACGSCVAFGTIATLECQANIQSGDSSLDLDLSEADLFFCGAGRKCQQGWWPTYALDYAKNEGVADEECFAYEDHNVDCNLCKDKSERLIKIGKWQEIASIDQRKSGCDTKGPMVACMAVYRYFFSYKQGIYRHVTGALSWLSCSFMYWL